MLCVLCFLVFFSPPTMARPILFIDCFVSCILTRVLRLRLSSPKIPYPPKSLRFLHAMAKRRQLRFIVRFFVNKKRVPASGWAGVGGVCDRKSQRLRLRFLGALRMCLCLPPLKTLFKLHLRLFLRMLPSYSTVSLHKFC